MLAISELLGQGYMQLGFAGFCFMLIYFIVWLIKTHNKINGENTAALVNVIKENNKVLARVFDGLKSITESSKQVKYSVEKHDEEVKKAEKELAGKVDSLRELVLARPCMKDK